MQKGSYNGSMPADHPVVRFWGDVYDGLGHRELRYGEGQKTREDSFVNTSVRIFHLSRPWGSTGERFSY